MKRVILSALMLVALLSGTYLLSGVAFAAESEPDRPKHCSEKVTNSYISRTAMSMR